MALELDDLYDEATRRRLDRHGACDPPPDRRPAGRRPRLATGVLVAALVGLRDVLEDDERHEPVIEVAPDPGTEPVRGVSLLFVPGVPEATVAVVR